ncbi:MAG: hypothetical protein K8J08_08790 [Thermoanaerobaculia bacterium]|nr:hypothetical protein [Thermoanaerobaculia bacterium]
MTEASFPAVETPTWTPIFKAQLRRTLGARRKLGWVFLAIIVAQIVALGSLGIVFGLHISTEVSQDTTQATVSPLSLGSLDEFDMGGRVDEGLAAVWLAGAASLLLSLLWPIRVWAGEPASRRDYHYAMPVRRSHHDLTRVLAGGVWVAVVSISLVLVAVLTATLFDHTSLFSRLTPWFWLNLLIAPLLVYTLASIVYVRASSRPSAWLWGGFWALSLVVTTGAAVAPDLARTFARSPVLNPIRTLIGPLFGEIAATTVTQGGDQILGWLLWSTIFLAGLWIAASTRPKRL